MEGDKSTVLNVVDRLEGLSLKVYRSIRGPKKRYKRPPYNRIPTYRDYEPSLPLRRPRALTLPLPSPTSSKGRKGALQSIDPQSESLLMRLPIEIRLYIYNAVLGYQRVHISFRSGPDRYENETVGARSGDDSSGRRLWEWSWWNTICTWRHHEDASYRNILADDLCGHTRYWNWSEKHWPPRSTGGMQKLDFAILLTCRKIYSEVIDLLYRTTTFVFNDPQLFRIFPKFVLPKRFAEITSIEGVWRMPPLTLVAQPGGFNASYYHPGLVKYWNDLCTILANMPNLNHLKIVLADYHCRRPAPRNLREMWLEPLEKLRGKNMKVFEIWVPESFAVHFRVDGQSHFKLNTISDIMPGVLDNANARFHPIDGTGSCGPVGYWLGTLPLPFPQS